MFVSVFCFEFDFSARKSYSYRLPTAADLHL